MPEIHGNIEGIRKSTLDEMLGLYDYPFEADEFLPQELALVIARYSAAFNREVALYVTRGGDVLDVVVGQQDNVSLPSMRLRRSDKRLSMIRVIHTHPKCSAELSDVDLTALRSLYLDAICAVGTDGEGNVTAVSCAFLGEKKDGVPQVILAPLYPLSKLPQRAWMAQIEASDELVKQGSEKLADSPERALLMSLDSEESLDELAALAQSAGAVIVGRRLQHKGKPDGGLYVGSGKAAELALDAQALEADLLIVDDELTGIQTRNLEEQVGIKVVDRTTLILDIFAQRAKTGEGKLQVSLAQLRYQQSRLIGQGLILSRLAGGIGTRGPGESKLEIDRRRIRERVTELRRQLAEMEKQRAVRRKNRERNAVPTVALVGYTNTGKSTLLNFVTDAGVYVKDQLFATLDAVSRKVKTESGEEFLLTDTVGFISKLPTELIEAFKSTLEEAARADLIVIVSDASNKDMLKQHKTVEEVLQSLGADTQPRIDALNKCDKLESPPDTLLPGAIPISAKTGAGVDQLLSAIASQLKKAASPVTVLVPFSAYQMMNDLRAFGRIEKEEHLDSGTRVTVLLSPDMLNRVKARWGEFFPKES